MINETVLRQIDHTEQRGRVQITGWKLNLKCKSCGRTWGVYLDVFGNLPSTWDTCIDCSMKKKAETKQILNSLEKEL